MELPPRPSADRFEDLTPREKELVRAVATQMHRLAYNYVVPVSITDSVISASPSSLNSGSASTVRAGNSVFALTANHVIEKLEKRRERGEDVDLFLHNLGIPIPERIHWRSAESDLALLRLTPAEVTELDRWVYDLPPPENIPVPPKGAYILAVGFPKYFRDSEDPTELCYGAHGMILRITTTGLDRLQCKFERDQWISDDPTLVPKPGTHLGGMSGGPVLLVGQLHFPFVGVLQEFGALYDVIEKLDVSSLTRLPPFEYQESV